MSQLDLFSAVLDAYADQPSMSNSALYAKVADCLSIDGDTLHARARPVSGKGRDFKPMTRRLRWVQQTMKHMGLLERADRGVWTLTNEGRRRASLKKIESGHVMLAFSTDLGVALWADCRTAFDRLDNDSPIHLVLTSPPYPLAKPRAYGNPSEVEYVDWICEAIEPIVRRLAPGGSIVLNVSNDVFEPGLPSRSLYRERLVLALHDRLGLHKMDEIPWLNPSKPPGPVKWASMERVQMNVTWEPVYWFTNDPSRVRSDNRRVLQPHTEKHLQFLKQGGIREDRQFSDGAYSHRAGKSYSSITEGRIPRNLLKLSHNCASQRAYKRQAVDAGLPPHGAPFPLALAEFFIRFLTVEGELVADPFGGSLTVPLAAEQLGRNWIATDVIWEYLMGGAMRFESPDLYEGFLNVAA